MAELRIYKREKEFWFDAQTCLIPSGQLGADHRRILHQFRDASVSRPLGRAVFRNGLRDDYPPGGCFELDDADRLGSHEPGVGCDRRQNEPLGAQQQGDIGGANLMGVVASCIMFYTPGRLPEPLLWILMFLMGASASISVLMTTTQKRNDPRVTAIATSAVNTMVTISGAVGQQGYGFLLKNLY